VNVVIIVEAVYENGVLRPTERLPLQEHERVQVTIQPKSKSNWVQETAGILGWKGSAELAERFAMDVDLEYSPAPEEP
jgi:predicted DNA-binding antitoxin AbrB/MazE fold protein